MKIKNFLSRYFNKLSVVCIILAFTAGIILAVSKISPRFADCFNRYVSAFFRAVISKITGILPFSLGEAIVLCIPIFAFVALFLYFKVYSNDDVTAWRFVVSMLSCISLMFTSFVVMFGVAYNGSDLAEKLELDVEPVTYDELEQTAYIVLDELEMLLDDIEYRYNGSSRLPYSFNELNSKMNDAFASFCEEYEFVQKLRSNVKIISVSPIMTYTHISGVFTYYTAEANVNINYPDYTIAYTMAHEMSHQRGIAPEDEANFTAFLVCLKSNDPFIRYSAYMSMLEYLMSAMSSDSYERYSDFTASLDMRIKGEMMAFNTFFEPYSDSTASKVSGAINDTYLKASGEEVGAKSYGMVVDLACAYYKSVG